MLLIAALLLALLATPRWIGGGQERISQEALGASFEPIAELAVEEYVYSSVGSFDKERLQVAGVEVPFTAKSFLVTFDGRVTAGIRNAEAIAVKVDDAAKTVTVSVPRPEVLSSDLDEASVVVHDQSMNPLNQVKVEDVTGFIAEQEQIARDKAVTQGLLKRATARTEELMSNHAAALIAGTSLEDYEVKVRWQ